jgi:hypothetical protein
MTAFEGNFNCLLASRLCCFFLEFGVLPEIGKAIDEMEWT